MKILYLSTSYIPSRRASSIHVMRMCQALAHAGHHVTLVAKGCPAREEPGVPDPFAFYGVAPLFALRKVAHPAVRGGGVVFSAGAWRLLRQLRHSLDLVYSRDLVGAWLALGAGRQLVFEAHGLPEGAIGALLWRRVIGSPGLRRLVVISDALRALLRESGLLPSRVETVVAHDGADPVVCPVAGKTAPVAGIGGAVSDRSLGYVGSMYAGRGVELVAELAERLPDATFHVVGGSAGDLAAWRARETPPNLQFYGFVPPERLSDYYSRFAIALMPYQRNVAVATGNADTSRWMSPMKMFEYMAAGRAIVASDLPVLREVLEDGRNALLVPPDDVGAWERAVRRLLSQPQLARMLGEAARKDLEAHYTWGARACTVLEGIGGAAA